MVRLAAVMPTIDWRSPRLPLVVAAIVFGVLVLAIGVMALIGVQAPLRYAAVPQVEGSVPQRALALPERLALFGLDSPATPPPALVGAPNDALAPRLDVDPALVEWRDGTSLPQRAADGRRPLDVYARAMPAIPVDRPMIAILVTDLGLDGERLQQSVMLPGVLSLAHTSYAAHLPAWQRHARWHGHEVLLELPLQPADFPRSDLGPWALQPTAPAEVQLRALQRVLARSDGYVGLAAASDGFAAMVDRFAPVAADLAARGLGFIELGDNRLAPVAEAAGLPYASAVGPLDTVLEPDFIDAALGQLEGAALRDGVALGFVQAYPLTFDRLWNWANSLDAKGISLVPVSSLLRTP